MYRFDTVATFTPLVYHHIYNLCKVENKKTLSGLNYVTVNQLRPSDATVTEALGEIVAMFAPALMVTETVELLFRTMS